MKVFLSILSAIFLSLPLKAQIYRFIWDQSSNQSFTNSAKDKVGIYVFVLAMGSGDNVEVAFESQNILSQLEKYASIIDYDNFVINVVYTKPTPPPTQFICPRKGTLEIDGFNLSTAFGVIPHFILIDTTNFSKKEVIQERRSISKSKMSFIPAKDSVGLKSVPFVVCSKESDLLTLISHQDYNFAYLVSEIKSMRVLVDSFRVETLQNKTEIDSLKKIIAIPKKK